MDTLVYKALEEICSQVSNGLTLTHLWSTLHPHISSNGLHLSTDFKSALWSNLINIPGLRFECKGVVYDATNPKIHSVEASEAMELKIVAPEHMVNNFLGIYDIKASDSGVSPIQRRVLERLAIARTDGVAQHDLAKEVGKKNNDMFYVLKQLETRGLIVKQSAMIRKKVAGNEEHKNGSIVNTNMLYLHRYAKHLGRLQRLEITKEDKAFTDNDDEDREVATGEGVSEERINNYVPAFRAICDRLEKANGKVLVVSDIKRELGYRKTHGHRAWRNILNKLKDASIVEEFFATVNNKDVNCLRLLKKFSPETFMSKGHGGGGDDLDTEHVKPVKRGQITEQLYELPIEQQIYDMINAAGSKGLTLNEVYKRLGINNKRYYPRILDMVSRFRMHIDSESLNRGSVYRVWTCGNYNSGAPNTLPGKSEHTMIEKLPTHAQAGQLMLTYTIQDADDKTSNVDAEAGDEQSINPIPSANDTWLDSNDQLNAANDIVPNAELQIVTVKSPSNPVSLEISSFGSPAPRRRRSYTTYPCIGFKSVNSLREQRILEKLQEEKFFIQPELQRLLDSINNHEKKQCTTMDKKTLERSLNKLQEDGHCKCVSFAVPSLTNIGRKRIVDVILHPSVYEAEDLSDRVHEKLRLFEKQLRTQSSLKHKVGKCNKSIPVLNVERINTGSRIDSQSETCEAMKNNGFVLAKMVRAKLLHVFLWGYLTGLPGWDDAIKDGYEQKNPHSSCKLFELGAAIKAMPLELFLQVAGSSLPLESMVEKCRKGLCLSDLPVQEYRSLMDTRATGRLSILIDILTRIKLIRLIGGDIPVGPHTTLGHSLEFKPYIEEPVGMVLPYTGVNSFDLRPQVRHDFVLASKTSVDEYWSTLEYCYAASDPKAALHAFPGSTVREVYHARAWASVRVMTAHQRAELLKVVANEEVDKKISFKKCEKIAENLHLTLEQVLRVFYDKRQKSKLKLAGSAKEHEGLVLTHSSLPSKRKKSSKRKSPVNYENSLDEESGKPKQAKIASNVTEEQSSLQRLIDEIDDANMLINDLDGQKDVNDDVTLNQDEDAHSYSAIHDCVLSKLQSSRQKRFSWTENKDRQLVTEYVKHRVALGAKFHRVEWSSLPNLPGPPDTCRRRMAMLNRNKQFRKALMRLCNMLSVRYAIHLDASKNKSLGDNCGVIVKDCDLIDHTKDMNSEERWDDFDNNNIQMVLNEVLKYKPLAKLEAPKSPRCISKFGQSVGESHALDESNFGSSSTPKDGGKGQASTQRSRSRLSKSYIELMKKIKDFGTQAYQSLAVSNAIELFKLIFLSTAKAPEVSFFLAETLRRYSEHDLFTAFKYLKDKNFMVRGSDIGRFVLSRQFLRYISLSPFPSNTGKRVGQMSRWLHERKNDLLDNGVDLSADLQCGDILQLCVLLCTGEVSVFPCLPHEGIGEIEELKKRKYDDNEDCSVEITKKPKLLDNETFTRKEKGFPGIRLSVSRRLISRVDEITSSVSNVEYNSLSSGPMEGVSKSNGSSESTWEAMTCYARHLESSAELSPYLFKTVYSAIHKSGDQGLTMEGISHIIDVQGEKVPELVVEVLEAFGRALKVNAYASVHVVDSLYRSKYMLTSTPSHLHDLHLKVPESLNNDDEPLKLQQENLENKHKKIMKETSTDLAEVHTNTEEVRHRVTILNHLEEVPQPMSEAQKNNEIETLMGPRKGPHEKTCEFRMDDSGSYKPILPWLNGDGTINKIVYKGLVRRVLGIVMQNPGILEEHIISQMNVLNPQSCRTLLELMILDSHIMVRKIYQSVSNEPPSMLQRLLGSSSSSLKKPKLICREHLFANPRSIDCL